MQEAGLRVRVRMPVPGKASVAEVKINAFGAAMSHAGDVLVEAMITSYSNMKALMGSSTGTSCRCLGSLSSLLFCVGRPLGRACASSSKLALFGLGNELWVVLWALLHRPLAIAITASHKLVPSKVAGAAKVT